MPEYKVMFAGDLHKRMQDIATIKGYTRVNRLVQLELMRLIDELKITHFISLGDWYDRGYGSDVSASLSDTDIDRVMSDKLNGNFYGLIGNHVRLNMDSNPELSLIQPHNTLTTRHPVVRKEQIIKTPRYLELNDVQISFMHYDKEAKSAGEYKPLRMPRIKYHIALFHTPYVIPSFYLQRMNMNNVINDNSRVAMALEDVDLAIVGDIHKPLGTFKIDKSAGKPTTMIVPGSLTNTDSGLGSRHNTIDIPIVTIHSDSTITLEKQTIDLCTNKLTFKDPATRETENGNKLKSIRGNNKARLYDETETRLVGNSGATFMSLNAFMEQQGYKASDKAMMKSVMDAPEDINNLVKIYREEHSYE